MKKFAMAGIVAMLLCGTMLSHAAEMPQMPKPGKQHNWLQRFVGQWETKVSMFMEPGKPPMQAKMTEKFRSVGGFWVIGDFHCDMMGQQFDSVLTVGYSNAKKKYVGTWLDSSGDYLWNYEGSVDAKGTTLTLNTEGPCPAKGGKIMKIKEVTEFKNNDHRIFTSSMLENGKWTKMMVMESWRKKTK